MTFQEYFITTGGVVLQSSIIERVISVSDYIIENGATVRQTAKVFGVSKSTVHNDIIKRLNKIDKERYVKVKKILDYNFSIRHLRGGESTKNRYLHNKKIQSKTHNQ